MTIALTTPAEGGVIANGETYTHMRIARLSMDVEEKRIDFVLLYGSKVDGKFVRSSIKHMKKQIAITGSDYTTIVNGTTSTGAGENHFKGVQDALHQWLMDNGYGDGTIE